MRSKPYGLGDSSLNAGSAAWVTVGEGIRSRLRNGFNIVVHCKGGLGRAGTIAARLLVELGADPVDSIQTVREARPDAIETVEQERHVQSQRSVTSAGEVKAVAP